MPKDNVSLIVCLIQIDTEDVPCLTKHTNPTYDDTEVFQSTCKSGKPPRQSADFLRLLICSMGGMGRLARPSTILLHGFEHPAHPRFKARSPSLSKRSKL